LKENGTFSHLGSASKEEKEGMRGLVILWRYSSR